MKKQLTILLLMSILLSTFACGGEGTNDVTTGGDTTFGHSDDPSVGQERY